MSSGGGGQTTVQKADPWAGAQPFLLDYMQQAQQLSQTPMEQFAGQTVLPYSAQTQSGIRGLESLGQGPLIGGAQNQAQRTLEGEYLGLSPELQRGVIDPSIQAVGSQFERAGRYGSGGHTATATRAAMDALAPFYEAERGRMQQMIPMAPSIAMSGITPQLQAGQMIEAKQAEELADQVRRFQFEQQEPIERLQRYASLVSPGAGFGGATTGTSQQPSGSNTAGILGTAMMAAPYLLAMSDRRLKHNLKRVGELPSGIPVYDFSYIGSDERITGVMAQDVLPIIPDAVETMPSGYMAVNYGALR